VASEVNRRDFLRTGCAVGAALGAPLPPAVAAPPASELDEVTVRELQRRLASGELTSHALAQHYQDRIEALDRSGPAIRSVIEINPQAEADAEALDRERKSRGTRGPLHGIPVLLKDNISTAGAMQTTAGSLALEGFRSRRDAFLVRRLRAAGALILGKTNLSEWANFRSNHSTSGWSGRGGLTHNPYATDRNACGSSSGSGAAVAANLCAVAVGTETDGSVVCPSSINGVVGLKPTVGLVSRTGIVPISHSQDTAGPMCRSVADVAALLSAMAGVDSADAASRESAGKAHRDYTRFLDPDGLRGARIGVLRKSFGISDASDHVTDAALEVMKQQGAVLVDPIEIPSLDKVGHYELEVLLYEFKADLKAFFDWAGPACPMHTLRDVIEFNSAHREREMPYFGQELMEKAQTKGPLTDTAYREALQNCRRLTRTEGIDAVMEKHRLDAIVAPTAGPAWVTDLVNGDHDSGGSSTAAAIAGYPDITVPAGFIFGLPVGISFFGRAWSEPVLLKLAHAFEQATRARRPPQFLATANLAI
jgi:amidase